MKNKKSKNMWFNIAMMCGVIISITIIIGMFWMSYFNSQEDLPEMPTIPTNFNVPSEEIGNFTLDSGWQLVSMPDNINKTSIYINYENDTYKWDDAIDNNLIANVVMEYSNNGYVSTNYLLKTRGYWIYCYVDGIQLSDEPSVIYCGKLYTGYSNMSNITCSRVVIAPEFYDNDIYCNTFVATDFYEFYYEGGDVLDG